MNFELVRYRLTAELTDGRLLVPGATLYTIERPWLPGKPGGVPFKSCVPDGSYQLREHERANGDTVLALSNERLGVYYTEDEVPAEGGRYMVLIHPANYVEDVVGCIAPGLYRTTTPEAGRPMVKHSRDAWRAIMRAWTDALVAGYTPTLTIRTEVGAS